MHPPPTMGIQSLKLGNQAESRVKVWYQENRNAHLIVQNYRCKGGEIDLIFEEIGMTSLELQLIFVEVRVRTGGWVSGLESIQSKKRTCLRKAARHFLSRYQGQAKEIRFDLLTWDGKEWKYYPDFLPGP